MPTIPLPEHPVIGSLFSGYGGLDLGVMSVLGGRVAWHVEFEDGPSRILAHHWPDVPNYGDIRNVDWKNVPRVNVLTGGFPCQDVSLAGRRAGLKAGTRSGLWVEYARAIDELRPELVVIENVRGLLSAEATGVMEPDAWNLGDRGSRPTLRALGAVLGDLADLGYDAEWCGVRAADAGAPHSRFRVFVAAHPADTDNGDRDREERSEGRRSLERVAAAGSSHVSLANSEHFSEYGSRGSRDGWPESANGVIANSRGDESERRRTGREMGGAASSHERPSEERQRVRDTTRDCGATATDAPCVGRGEGRTESTGGIGRPEVVLGSSSDWGQYAAAVSRWEQVTGLVAPPATTLSETYVKARSRRLNGLDLRPVGMRGSMAPRHQLSALFVEWMMGLEPGHVTGAGISRNAQLKALGNGVVPQQAALALRLMLPALGTAA